MMNDQQVILSVSNLNVEFPTRSESGPVRAVRDVNFTLAEKETLAIVGESGSGKSTTARAVLRLVPSTGSIEFRGQEIQGVRGKRLQQYRKKVQMVFQDPYSSLNPVGTIESIIFEPMRTHGGLSRQKMRARVAELLDLVGLPQQFAQRHPHQLSGGQRQRVAIARAIALNPEIMVLDEALSALDVSTQAQIIEVLRRVRSETGVACLFISHDLAVVRMFADRVAVVNLGSIVEAGDVESIFTNPKHAYTQALLASVPVPDVEAQAKRRGTLTAD